MGPRGHADLRSQPRLVWGQRGAERKQSLLSENPGEGTRSHSPWEHSTAAPPARHPGLTGLAGAGPGGGSRIQDRETGTSASAEPGNLFQLPETGSSDHAPHRCLIGDPGVVASGVTTPGLQCGLPRLAAL